MKDTKTWDLIIVGGPSDGSVIEGLINDVTVPGHHRTDEILDGKIVYRYHGYMNDPPVQESHFSAP